MKHILLTISFTAFTITGIAHAQFGSGIVLDPTQSAHAAQQILQANQLYSTTIQATKNVIAAYNLAQKMASIPESLYTSYSNMGRQQWTTLTTPANTYGNSLPWMNAASTGYGAASANQAASMPHVSQISEYNLLTTQGQQAVAAQGATVDLTDAVNASSLQTLGTIRASAPQREIDISNLEAASHSTDAAQQTEMATLQRINQAMLIQLRTQQEAMQVTLAQTLQQMVQQKQQQDAMKLSLQAADGYEAYYNSHVSRDTIGTTKALGY